MPRRGKDEDGRMKEEGCDKIGAVADSLEKLDYSTPRPARGRGRWWKVLLLVAALLMLGYGAYLCFYAWPRMVG